MKKIGIILNVLLLAGCTLNQGPGGVPSDTIDYNKAVHTSNDSQLLLNMVRLRYRDTPTFLQIGNITAEYENSLEAALEFNVIGLNNGDKQPLYNVSPGASVARIEKPATQYQIVGGEEFTTGFLSPITLESLVLLNSSGWKIERILRCCVQRINTIRNAPTASGPTPKYAPHYQEFLELCSYFSELEQDDAVDMILEKNPETDEVEVYLVIDKNLANPAILERIWSMLGVNSGLDRIRIVHSHHKKHSPTTINVDTRSPLSVLYYLSHSVRIPESDVLLGKVTRTEVAPGCEFDWDNLLGGLMKVYSSPIRCGMPSAWVRYRGTFFYIDDSDLDSKSTFSMLTQLLALQHSTPNIPATVYTIPIK